MLGMFVDICGSFWIFVDMLWIFRGYVVDLLSIIGGYLVEIW